MLPHKLYPHPIVFVKTALRYHPAHIGVKSFLWARGPLQFPAVGWVPAAGQETITI